MRITEIATHVVDAGSRGRTWLFVEVRTDEGLAGYGEGSQSRNDAGVIREIEQLKPLYLGHDPLEIIEARRSLLDAWYAGKTMFCAVSALEQALWDLCGKRLGAPVYRLLGGRCRERVRAYANISLAPLSADPEAPARLAEAAAGAGFTAVKLSPFGRKETERSAQAAGLGVERVRAVRAAIGPETDLLVDMQYFFDENEARRLARALEPLDLFWLEDPFGWDDAKRLAALRREVRPRLAGGAALLRRREFRPLLEEGALDVIMPDVKWLGGILESKKAAAMADAYGVACAPHNLSGPVSCAASVHLSLGLSHFLLLEYPWPPAPWRAELCGGTERIEGGAFLPPEAPGLSLAFDPAVAAKHRADG